MYVEMLYMLRSTLWKWANMNRKFSVSCVEVAGMERKFSVS